MESHFEDAIADAQGLSRGCGRSTTADRRARRVRDDQRRHPGRDLAADDDIVGPYFLWRLLIDERFQGRGYGAATLDAVAAYVRAKPNGDAANRVDEFRLERVVYFGA